VIGAVHLAGTLINAGTVLVGTAIGTLAGAVIGGLFRIDDGSTRLGETLKRRFAIKAIPDRFAALAFASALG
jgi:uncharacterized membrane protein YqgA involved in biofilm formation